MQSLRQPILLTTIACIIFMLGGRCALAQNQPEPPAGMVTLNFPDTVDLQVLIDYVAKRHGMNFIYDEQVAGKKITIKATQPIPATSLTALLESTLKMKGLALAKTPVPGTFRIEVAQQLTAVSVGPDDKLDDEANARTTLALTRVFELKHSGTQRAEQVLTPFLSASTANITSLPDLGLIIVTDYAANIPRLEQMVAVLDRPARDTSVRFIRVINVDATDLSQKVSQLMGGKGATAPAAGASPSPRVTLVADERTNQVAVMGSTAQIEEAVKLIESLDVPLGLKTQVYALNVASPERVDQMIRGLIGELTEKRLYKSASDRDSNLLMVTTTDEIHSQIQALLQTLDQPVKEEQSPIRFYKLENAKAIDVLDTLRSIEGNSGLESVSVDGVSAENNKEANMTLHGPTEAEVNRTARQLPGSADNKADDRVPPQRSVQLKDARVMADASTNTIIIVASPAMQSVYERLIKRLDVRRPQVLVEATVVAIDTTNGFSLGVELSTSDGVDGGTLLNFTQFGLSMANPATGALALTPGVGFNGALLGSNTVDVIIRALEKDSRAKVVSKTSILVNDNAKGELLSEAEEPFATVTASGVAGATTSFGGFAAAGSKIDITPQISEGDHLKLEYEVSLSNFTESGTDQLPPARQSNALKSVATIPDGYTIVVGGLTKDDESDFVDRVPILGRLPGLEYLFSNRSKTKQKTTLFVFIHAVILRDDQFSDLKTLSRDATGRAELPDGFPASEPVEIP